VINCLVKFLVVDVYAEWCGPCIPMIANLKKIKLELGGEILHYAIVNIRCIYIYGVILCSITMIIRNKIYKHNII